MPELIRDGLTINYETRGEPSAPAVVLLHGYTSELRAWHQHMEALCPDYFVVAPDARGHGRSASPAELERYEMSEYVADLKALLDSLDIEIGAMVGSSFGGMIAMNFAVQYPERIAALVLSDTSPAYAHERYDDAYRQREAGVDANVELVKRMGTAELGKRAAANIADPFAAEAMRKRYARLNTEGFVGAAHCRRTRPDVTGLLREKLTMPVMICTGDKDPVRCAFPVMLDELPGARALTFRDTGHGVPNLRPDAFLKELFDFFDAVEDGIPVAARRTV